MLSLPIANELGQPEWMMIGCRRGRYEADRFEGTGFNRQRDRQTDRWMDSWIDGFINPSII